MILGFFVLPFLPTTILSYFFLIGINKSFGLVKIMVLTTLEATYIGGQD
jgi:hypothetical protein